MTDVEHRDFSAYEPSETEYTDHTVSYGQKYCEACWGELDTGFRCMKCGRQYHPRRGSVVAIEEMDNMIDDILLQEIFSLREKLKIAIEYIKFYNPAFDENEFVHQVGSVDYDQWIEELYEEGDVNDRTQRLC